VELEDGTPHLTVEDLVEEEASLLEAEEDIKVEEELEEDSDLGEMELTFQDQSTCVFNVNFSENQMMESLKEPESTSTSTETFQSKLLDVTFQSQSPSSLPLPSTNIF